MLPGRPACYAAPCGGDGIFRRITGEKGVRVERTDRRRFHRHRPPVGAELVGEDLRQAGIDALPQLRLRHGDDDAAVGGALEERVEQGFALGNAPAGWVDSRPSAPGAQQPPTPPPPAPPPPPPPHPSTP